MYDYKLNKRMHVAVKDGAALSEIVTRLGAIIESAASNNELETQDRRSCPRRTVMIPGLVQVLKSSGEIMVFPVQIRNISTQGMLLEFKDKGHVFAGMLKEIEGLSVTFQVDDSVATLECLPKRIVLDDPVEVGVEVSDDSEDKPRIQRFLM
ncbi:hypothetical protein [uncultured Pseudodesulfovibrio sp.]|uniref:hypothetical protein n=1 Tax=uncultured Pseudodesulfovibrio sp. TaxID=2035858 RepID=UPI0029C96DB1|nr:hypothetical protein [uncultured Pseudodesulfovibrio sp.]